MQDLISDAVLIETIQKCELYAATQKKIEVIMANGIFQISLTRQNNRMGLSVLNCRQDIKPYIRLNMHGDDGVELVKAEEEDTSIYMLSGLPTKNTRNAQSAFHELLNECITLVKPTKDILSVSNTLANVEESVNPPNRD